MKKINQLLLALSLFAISSVASATVITGTILFSGDYTTDTGNKDTASVFTFLNPINVGSATGSFAPLSGGTVTYNALDLNAIPATPLWSATVASVTYSFDLNNIVDDQVYSIGGKTTRSIYGTGLFTIGTDIQYGDWLFTTQGDGAGTGASAEFSFSAESVPEPGVALLLGVGLIGFAVSRKLRKTA